MTTISPTNISTRPSSGQGGAFLRSFRSAWLGITTLRSTMALPVLIFAVGFAAPLLINAAINLEEGESLDPVNMIAGVIQLTGPIALIAGILLFTADRQHGTASASLMAQPSRTIYALSRVAVGAVFGGLLGLANLVAGIAGTLVAGVETSEVTDSLSTTIWMVPVAALAAMAGVGIGMLGRTSALSISVSLAWWFIVESIIGSISAEAGKYLPFTALRNIVETFDETTTRGGALLLFVIFTAAVVGLGTAFFSSSDAS